MLARRRLGVAVQALGDFFLVSLAIQLRQTAQHFDTRSLRDGVADAVVLRQVRYFVEAMLKVEVIPAVGVCDSGIHFMLQCAQSFDTGVAFGFGMEAVVEHGQADAVDMHDVDARLMEPISHFT